MARRLLARCSCNRVGWVSHAFGRRTRIIQSLRCAAAGRGSPARRSERFGRDRPCGHTAPLPPCGVVTATDCPMGPPEGWETRVGRGACGRSHTRRYQPRWGQLHGNLATIRRVLTTTSAATWMSSVRHVQGCPSPSGSHCRRCRNGRCRATYQQKMQLTAKSHCRRCRNGRCRSAPSAPPPAHTSRGRKPGLTPLAGRLGGWLGPSHRRVGPPTAR
jgi:hypothetical protein